MQDSPHQADVMSEGSCLPKTYPQTILDSFSTENARKVAIYTSGYSRCLFPAYFDCTAEVVC